MTVRASFVQIPCQTKHTFYGIGPSTPHTVLMLALFIRIHYYYWYFVRHCVHVIYGLWQKWPINLFCHTHAHNRHPNNKQFKCAMPQRYIFIKSVMMMLIEPKDEVCLNKIKVCCGCWWRWFLHQLNPVESLTIFVIITSCTLLIIVIIISALSLIDISH